MMFSTQEIMSFVMMIIGLGGLAASLFFSTRRDNRDVRDSEIENKVQIERIASTTDSTQRDVRDIKNSFERLDGRVDKITDRVSKIEYERETLWRRIDEHTDDLKCLKGERQ